MRFKKGKLKFRSANLVGGQNMGYNRLLSVFRLLRLWIPCA